MFENKELKNEKFVIKALYQISEELFARLTVITHLTGKEKSPAGPRIQKGQRNILIN